MKKAILPAALLVAFFGSAIQAAPVTGYTSAWFFGDSLSDPGNLYAATGGAVPQSPPYFEGRRTNGPVWAEHVAAEFTERGLPTQNYAFIGAHALEYDDPGAFQLPDLPDQIAAFGATATGHLGDAPVAALWAGANDILTAITPTATPQSIASIAANAALAVGAGISALEAYGVDTFVVMNLPALDKTPAFTLAAPAAAPLAKLGTEVYNATLASVLAGLDVKVTSVDMYGLFNDLIANPEKYGVANATIPCLIPGRAPCTPEQANLLGFFDLLHPNQVIHGQIAAIAAPAMAPVPLPASALLLLAGLAGFGLMRRRAA